MDNFVIVIGRQFGCGGRKIGRQIADAFGVPYYDKELLSKAAEEMGFSKDIFSRADEKRPSMMRSLLHLNYGAYGAAYEPGTLSGESLYKAQSSVIRSICDKGSCVIVGRTADYVMREHPRLVSVFIHAPIDTRVKEIIARGDAKGVDEAIELANKFDRNRESYYNYFTNRHWGTASNYDLTFDSSRFSIPHIISLIRALVE